MSNSDASDSNHEILCIESWLLLRFRAHKSMFLGESVGRTAYAKLKVENWWYRLILIHKFRNGCVGKVIGIEILLL